MMVAAGNDNLFRRLAGAIGRPSLADDPRFATNGERVVNRTALVAILGDILKTETRAHWARLFEAAGIPNGPINTMEQVVADPQTRALGQIQTDGALSLVGLPLSFDGERPPFAKRAPSLGEDNKSILG
jgi:crotonobetainyl-CoA:carnitine CoA-transferase CaiB-like acyl-CoA transferase